MLLNIFLLSLGIAVLYLSSERMVRGAAHLAFYLTKYLGCDPIIFVGQDLAYTGHVFYVPGVEIHRSWRSELNRFHTMEHKEWERIVRNRLDMLWEAGLLAGDQPGLEYLVKCDAELNPPEVRDAGQVNVNVVLRPIATAESIVVELRLAQEGSTVGSI